MKVKRLFDLGRIWRTVQPDGTSVTNEYHLTMEPKKTYGSRVYPEERGYDYSGRMKTLKTWQNFATDTGAAVTMWNYHTNRGWLISKQYPDSQGPSYTYSAAGRLASRTWARGVVTANTYDNAGALSAIDYDDSTPDVTFTHDRLGRQSGASTSNDAITYLHNAAGQLVAEVHGAGVLEGLTVTNTYDALLRRQALEVLHNSSLILHTSYGYDSASRLASVSDGTNSAHYGYLANSPLVESIVFKQNSTTRMTTTKSYDYVNRLTGIQSVSSASSVVYSYSYNSANQRTRVDEADGSYWLYEYDSLGQVISAKRYAAGGYLMPGQQHEYTYDDIGNRQTAKSGGDANGANLRESAYAANALNQYTNRTVPGYLEVQGSAHTNATVTVNNQATTRQGAYYRKELGVNNSPAAVWQAITNVAVLQGGGTNGADIVTTQSGHLFLRQTPEIFTYDADGNMTSDGRFNYMWDAENRLLAVESHTNAPTASRVKVEWTYDAKGRRIRQQSHTEQSGQLVLVEDLKFVADGWRHIAELNATNNAVVKSYAWGLDLSGSLDGAGGVGGLLFFQLSTPQLSTHFCAYDGNGNVRALFSANDGTLTAQYDYDAFGNTIRASGPAALAQPFRFSTKRANDLTSLVLYEYRAYMPWLGRWLNRDPLLETGGSNLLSIGNNNLISNIDQLGLQVMQLRSCCTTPTATLTSVSIRDVGAPYTIARYPTGPSFQWRVDYNISGIDYWDLQVVHWTCTWQTAADMAIGIDLGDSVPPAGVTPPYAWRDSTGTGSGQQFFLSGWNGAAYALAVVAKVRFKTCSGGVLTTVKKYAHARYTFLPYTNPNGGVGFSTSTGPAQAFMDLDNDPNDA